MLYTISIFHFLIIVIIICCFRAYKKSNTTFYDFCSPLYNFFSITFCYSFYYFNGTMNNLAN